MPFDQADIEGDALDVYRRARLEPDDPPGVGVIVRALLKTPIMVAPMRARAQLARVGSEWRIYVRKGTDVARMRFDVGHELAHWYYATCRYFGEDIEQRCDAVAAAIVAPMPFFRAIRKRIEGVSDVASAIGVTQSTIVLREGEVFGIPTALVDAARVRIRGDEWGWPSEQDLRQMARRGHPLLRKIEITDEPKRVGLTAA